jgi:hypothetical protein
MIRREFLTGRQTPLMESPSGMRKMALAIYLLAVLVRFTLLFGFGRYEIARPEPVRVARSLAFQGTFADPYVIPTGPTAHVPPFYPMLVSPIYRILGDSRLADMTRMGFSTLTASAEYALQPYISASLGMGTMVGVAAGFAGAVIPLQHWLESQGEFEIVWTALFLQFSVIGFARWMRAPRFSAGGGACVGLWCGWGLLVSPNVLPVLAGLAVLGLAAVRRRISAQMIRSAAAFALAAITVVLPWTIRNRAVMGGWFLIRDNFGMELSSSNCDGATPDLVASHQVKNVSQRLPGVSFYAATEVKRKGELMFARDMQREAMAWIRLHPLEFARLTAGRVRNFWFPTSLPQPNQLVIWALTVAAAGGLVLLWRANGFGAGVLGIVLATYPAIFSLIKNSLRYQHPIYWVLLLLTAYLTLRIFPHLSRVLNDTVDAYENRRRGLRDRGGRSHTLVRLQPLPSNRDLR